MSDLEHNSTWDTGTRNADGSLQWSADREPIEQLAEEFADRLRNGERPTIVEYCSRYPDLASEIQDLFPSVLAMERLHHRKRSTGGRRISTQKLPVEKLGDFRIIHEIARGGMGIVYEAEQETLGRRVAIKVLPKHSLRSERDIQRFQREAQTSAKLHHTNIVPVFGIGHQDDIHFIVMQLIRGVGLDEVLSQLRQIVFCLPKDLVPHEETPRSNQVKRNADALLRNELRRDTSLSSTAVRGEAETLVSADNSGRHDEEPGSVGDDRSSRQKDIGQRLGPTYCRNIGLIAMQAANALGYAHSHKTLHRDIKPGNLLLDDEGVVWMADFGIAKALEQNDVTGTGDLVGTVCYMAPERFQGVANEQSDIYSLGLTLFELLTLTRAFDGADRVSVVHRLTNDEIPNPRKLNSSIPNDLETIVLKAAARNPKDRYQTASELASDLDAFLNDRPIQARRVGYVEHFVRWCRRNRAVAALAASVLLLLFTVFAVTSIGYVRESQQRHRAELTAQLAVDALDQIYGKFAPRQLQAVGTESSEGESSDGESSEAEVGESFQTTRGQLPLSNDVAVLLENLLQFYDQLSQQSSDNEELVLKSIRATRRVGDIQHRLDELPKAETAYRSAIARIQKLCSERGENQELDLEFARAQNGLGMVLADKRDRNRAVTAHRRAKNRLEENSSVAVVRFERARTLYLLHLAEHESRRKSNRDRRSESRSDHVSKAIAILNGLAAEIPSSAEYRFLLAKCFLAIGTSRDANKNEQEDLANKAIDILEGLIRREPNVPDFQYELGDAYWRIVFRAVFPHKYGSQESVNGETLSLAEHRIRRALEVTTDLELNHPNIPEYLRLKSRLHHLLAKILKDQDRGSEAEQEYDKAIEKQRVVVRQSRNPIRHDIWRTRIELHRAELQHEMGNFDRAKGNLEKIISELKLLLRNAEIQRHSHSRRSAKENLKKSYKALEETFRSMGETETADAVRRRADND